MRFDENLRALRKSKELSQEYLAERMNVSRQTISKWENGTAMPDLKKLTELAELFDTSMDELLGTSSPAPKEEGYSAEDVYDMIQKQIVIYDSKNKTRRIITSISIIILAIGLVINAINISSSVNNLQSSINNINPSSQIIYSDDDEPYIPNDVQCNIISIDEKDPRYAEVMFAYKPKSFLKNTVVKFTIIDMLSSSATNNEIIAEEKNGAFNASAKINFASFNKVNIRVDDGTSISEETLDIDWAVLYRGFTDTYIDYDYDQSGKVYAISFIGDQFVRWNNYADFPSITEAYIEAISNNETIYSNKLEIQNVGTYSQVTPKSFTIDKGDAQIHIKLIDEYGTRYYIYSHDPYDTESNEYNNIVIEFAKGGRLSMAGPHDFKLAE